MNLRRRVRVRVRAASCVLLLAVAVTVPVAADLVPDGKTYAPLELTLDNQSAFADTTMVVLGCNHPESGSGPGAGRHQVAFAKPTEALRCGIKLPPQVYAVPTKDVKPLQDLVAKDVGWAAEGIEARKLLEKGKSCGTIDETGLVDKSKNIKFFTARYALEKTPTGCSIKKVGETVAQTSPAAAASGSGSGSASASASAAVSGSPPADSASASSSSASPAASASGSATPAKAGGCGSCAVMDSRGDGNNDARSYIGAVACLGLALAGVARRRRRAKRSA